MLVTGGAGFIGSHLVDALLAAGQEPVVLDNFASGDRENLPDGAKLVEMDIADAGVVGAIAELNPEVVIHAAAQVSVAVSMQDPHLDLAVNVQGTANVIEGAKAASARRFVFVSSGGGVYGESDGAGEDTLPRPKSYYSAHKYLGERYVELSGLSYANARLANVYGTRQRSDLEGGVVAIFTERLHRGQPSRHGRAKAGPGLRRRRGRLAPGHGKERPERHLERGHGGLHEHPRAPAGAGKRDRTGDGGPLRPPTSRRRQQLPPGDRRHRKRPGVASQVRPRRRHSRYDPEGKRGPVRRTGA